MIFKNKLAGISIALVLTSTSAVAFNDSSSFSFNNRLVDAVNQNNAEIVEAMLSTGEDPNVPGKFDTYPLHRAVFNGNSEIVKLLIQNGADVNIMDYGGASPLHIAARTGKDAVAQELIADGADINSIDSQGYSPLHRAISNNQVPVSIMLLDKGAEVNTMNNEGDTPLIDAVKISNPELVKKLIIKGADKTAKNNKGLDALDYALKAGNKKIDIMLARSVEQLMREDGVSGNTVVASAVPAYARTVQVASAPASSVPAYLEKEKNSISAYADASPILSGGGEFIQSVKAPVEEVQEEVLDVPPVALNEPKEITPEQQIQERYQFAEIEQERYQPSSQPAVVAEEASLEQAPRLPDDGRLPKSLRADFLKIKQQQELAEAQTKAQQQMQQIELPKEVADIEYSSNTIQLPVDDEGSKPSEPVAMAKAFDELPKPQQEPSEPVQAEAEQPVIDVPAYAKETEKEELPEPIQIAQNNVLPAVEPAFDVPASLLQPRIQPAAAPAVTPTPSANVIPVTMPVDSLQVISSEQKETALEVTPQIPVQPAAPVIQGPASAPVPQEVIAPVTADAPQQPEQIFYDASYAAEVDALMGSYIESVPVNESYSKEVDALMNSMIGEVEQQSASQQKFQPPAIPASLSMKHAVEELNLSKSVNSYVQQSIQATEYTSQPINKATQDTISENVMPKVPVDEVSETVVYQAEQPVMKKPANKDYNSYRSNLIKDINEFYNKDYSGFGRYDISDLEKERTTNLGITSTIPTPKAITSEPKQIESAPADAAKGLTSDDVFEDNDAPKAEYDSGSDTVAAPEEPAVEVKEMDKLVLPEPEVEAVAEDVKAETAPAPAPETTVKDVTPEEVIDEISKEEEKKDDTVKDINIDELLDIENPAN